MPQNETEEIKQPQNIEAEQAVLGAILLNSEAFDMADGVLRGEEFSDKGNARIFRVMRQLAENGDPIDLVSVSSLLEERKELVLVGGFGYLSDIMHNVPTAANVSYYAGLVLDKYLERMAIEETRELANKALVSGDTAELIANMQKVQDKLSDRATKGKDFHVISDVCVQCFETMEQTMASKETRGVTGLPSGFPDLDRMTSGFQKGDFIIVAARPSVGKTALALNIAQNIGIRQRETVAIFSLEMGANQLVQRMICAEGNIDANRMRNGTMESQDWESATMAISQLAEANILIDDTPSLNVSEMKAKCRRLKQEKGLGLILIDYLQLIAGQGRRENRQQEVSHISRSLKQLARELDVPVVALSQLSRGVEQRADKRPMMSDLRESGSLEQDADIVAFLYRDDYYNKDSEKKNIIEIIFAKQRNGPVGTVELAFLKQFNKFANLDLSHQEVLILPEKKKVSGNPYSRRG